jgi:pyrroline-5-carboxylate reductase
MFGTLVKATVFLGGGRITSALVAGLKLAKYDRPILVHDRNADKLNDLERQYGVATEPRLALALQAANLLIVAVRPDSVSGLLKKFAKANIHGRLTAVSLAAGVPLAKLRASLPSVRWARAMPSPVCRSGRGFTALAFAQTVPQADRKRIRKLFAAVGSVVEIPEKQFDAFTVTFSSSHGYHALASLIKAGEAVGLDHKTARLAAAHALADGISAWREGKLSLEELLKEAATPGGTAAAVMNSLDQADYQEILRKGLRTGLARAKKNARLTESKEP